MLYIWYNNNKNQENIIKIKSDYTHNKNKTCESQQTDFFGECVFTLRTGCSIGQRTIKVARATRQSSANDRPEQDNKLPKQSVCFWIARDGLVIGRHCRLCQTKTNALDNKNNKIIRGSDLLPLSFIPLLSLAPLETPFSTLISAYNSIFASIRLECRSFKSGNRLP